jgi:hypothetical protein
VRNEEVLLRINEQRSILHEVKKQKTNWIDHTVRRKLPSKRSYRRKHKGRDGRDKKTKKKT